MPRGSVKAETQLTASSRKLDPALKKAEGKYDKFGKRVSKRLKKSFSGLRSTIGTLGMVGGAAGLVAAGRQVMEFERGLVRLKNQSGKSWKEMDKFRAQVRKVSDATGASAEEVLNGARQYVSLTGDMDGATQALSTFSRVAVASGATMEDISSVAAALRDNLNIDPRNFEHAFSILLKEGNKGAVELKQFSGLMASLAAEFPIFGKTGVAGLSELGATMQVMRKGFGSAEEAATGFSGMMRGLYGKAAMFKKLGGIDVYTTDKNGEKHAKGLLQLVEEIGNSKLGKDPELLKKAFGRAEGMKGFMTVWKNVDALKAINEEAQKGNEIQKEYDAYQKSSVGRMQRSWERMKNTIARVFTPERIEMFAGAMEKLADLLKLIMSHLKEVAAIVGGIKLSSAFGTLATMFNPGKVGEAGSAWGAAAGKMFSGLAAASIAAAVTYAVTSALADKIDKEQEKGIQFAQDTSYARGMLTGKGHTAKGIKAGDYARQFNRTMRETGVVGKNGAINDRRLAEVIAGHSLGAWDAVELAGIKRGDEYKSAVSQIHAEQKIAARHQKVDVEVRMREPTLFTAVVQKTIDNANRRSEP